MPYPSTSGKGSPGPVGPKGDTGLTGPKGDTGAAGPVGPVGLGGAKGDTGPTGPQGAKGDTGSVGVMGLKGDTGVAGAKGDVGATGVQGPQGVKGDTGPAGSPGAKGDVGATGAAGVKGDTGPQGPKGDVGATGPTGPQGPAGTNGATGTPGTNGTSFAPQTPVVRTLTIGSPLQHTDASKAFKVVVNVRATQTLTVAGLSADKLELRVGPNAAAVGAGGSGGFSLAVWESGITGIALMIGAGIQDGGQLFADVPAGWYFQVNRLSGAVATVVSCFSQSMSA